MRYYPRRSRRDRDRDAARCKKVEQNFEFPSFQAHLPQGLNMPATRLLRYRQTHITGTHSRCTKSMPVTNIYCKAKRIFMEDRVDTDVRWSKWSVARVRDLLCLTSMARKRPPRLARETMLTWLTDSLID